MEARLSQRLSCQEEGDISFFGGEGVGTITQEGLKIPPGQPAINPVPRQMAEKAIRKIIGNKKENVTVSIPGGKELAKRHLIQGLELQMDFQFLERQGLSGR